MTLKDGGYWVSNFWASTVLAVLLNLTSTWGIQFGLIRVVSLMLHLGVLLGRSASLPVHTAMLPTGPRVLYNVLRGRESNATALLGILQFQTCMRMSAPILCSQDSCIRSSLSLTLQGLHS